MLTEELTHLAADPTRPANPRRSSVTGFEVYGQALVDVGRAEDAYRLVRSSMERVADPRLAVALVMTAAAAERYGEAAQILERLAEKTGRKALADHAARLRELEKGG